LPCLPCRQVGDRQVLGREIIKMDKFFAFIMYVLWMATLVGLVIITFTNFQYIDLNVIVCVLTIFTGINTIITIKRGSS
jgi:hypothetical protein